VDPSGTHFSWKANAIGGKNSKGMREFLEKEWVEGLDEEAALKLTIFPLFRGGASPFTGRSYLSCPYTS
jgi:20S proteasome alpha/beta subunit